MILYLTLQALISALNYATFFLPVVTGLPFGMDNEVSFFVSTVRGFIEVFPFAELPFRLMLWALWIEFLFFSWSWVKFLLKLMRG